MPTPTAPRDPGDLAGKTVAAVTTRSLAGRDTYKDLLTFEETTLAFTDGTTWTFSTSHTEVYDTYEYDGIDADGTPIPVTGQED